MNSTPQMSVANMIAFGTSRLASLASSESVDTASNPRNDRHRMAAPASTGPMPPAVPSPRKGAMTSTLPEPEMVATAMTRNTTMKIAWMAMIRKLARATETMPTMLSTVTMPMVTTMMTHGGIAGTAAFRYSPMTM
jgi:hypothetical protein